MKKRKFLQIIGLLCLILSLFAVNPVFCYAEEAQEETIAAYALPIESNQTKGWPEGPKIEAEAAIVMELDTGTVLYAKNIKQKEYPASITKLMTVLLALENGNLNDTVTFSRDAVYSIEPGSSHLGIRPDEQLSLRQSLFGIMLASANDISNGVAEHIGGTMSHFVEMMNQKAQELGCINTHFMNAHGLHDDNHYVCAYDMALIAKEVYKYPAFRTIAKTVECTIPPTNVVDETRYLLNHQKMLYHEDFKYEGCLGGKTGFTDQALNTLVTYAERNGTVLVSVILYLNGSDKTFRESALLLDYGFENFEKKVISNQKTDAEFSGIVGTEPVEGVDILASLENKSLQMDETSTLMLPKGSNAADIKLELKKAEDETGTLTYRYNGWPVGTANLSFHEAAAVPETQKQSETMKAAKETEAPAQVKDSGEKASIFKLIDRGVSKVGEWIGKADEYILNHKVFCIVICVVLLVIFVPMLVLTYFRAKKLSRKEKEMEWEREEIARIEREIEEKSTEEIENELRNAMKEEREAQQKAKRAIAALEEAKKRVNEIEKKKNGTIDPENEEDDQEFDENIEKNDTEESDGEERQQDNEEE